MTIVWLRLLYNISQCWKHVCGVMTVSREAEGRSKRSAQLSVPYIISGEQLSTAYLALVHNYNNKAKHRHGERHKNTMGTWRWLCTNKFIRVTGPFCSQHTISWRTWFLVRCHKQRNNPKKKNEWDKMRQPAVRRPHWYRNGPAGTIEMALLEHRLM